MKNYDFKTLSAYDFEQLARDLLSNHLNKYFHNFRSGRDGGIDLRYTKSSENEIIVQCKHYASSKYSQLIIELSNEKHKIDLLNPDRYIVFTSLALTNHNKNQIKEELWPYISSIDDIYGKEDINYLLGLYPEIEKRNFKLWLSSINMLDFSVHSKIINKTRGFLEKILLDAVKYVQTESLNKAVSLIEKYSFCLISGPPGTGKTTLAKIIILQYLKMGYELVYVTSNIDDAFEMFSSEKHQIFYFDDFLGRTRVEASVHGRDQSLIDFIDLISSSNKSVLVMTTREYLLNQAIQYFDEFEYTYPRIERAKFLLTMSEYSVYDKSLILYNHLYYSKFYDIVLDRFTNSLQYKKIVEHKNYLPRLIEWVIQEEGEATKDNIAAKILNHLDKPDKIWRSILDKQFTTPAIVLITLLYVKGMGTISELKSTYDDFIDFLNKQNIVFQSQIEFDYVIREIVGTLVSTDTKEGGTNIDFTNPSIEDYLSSYFYERPKYLIMFINYNENILELWDIIEKATINKMYFRPERLNAFSNPKVQDALLFRIQRLQSDSPYSSNSKIYKDILQKSFLVAANSKKYSPNLVDLCSRIIQTALEEKSNCVANIAKDGSNLFLIARIAHQHKDLHQYLISGMKHLASIAKDIGEAEKLLRLDSISGHNFLDREIIESSIKRVITNTLADVDELEELDIDRVIKIIGDIHDYGIDDMYFASALKIFEERLYRYESPEDSNEDSIDREEDEIEYDSIIFWKNDYSINDFNDKWDEMTWNFLDGLI